MGLILTVLLAWAWQAACQPAMPGADAAPAAGATGALCLELTPGQSRVRLGEPVVVAASLLNCSREPHRVDDLLAPEYGFLQVWLKPSDAKGRLACRPSTKRDARGKRLRLLAPGERLSAWVPLYACSDGWVLRQPGKYEVHAEYAVEGARLSAPPAVLEVVPADKPGERAAADIMMDKATGQMLLTGRDAGEGGSKRLSLLARQQPESHLASYAQAALGIASAQERFDPSIKDFRKADCPRAVDLLTPAVSRISDPFVAATAVRSLTQCLRALGRSGEAEEAIRDYSRAHPQGLELPGVRDVLLGTGKPRS